LIAFSEESESWLSVVTRDFIVFDCEIGSSPDALGLTETEVDQLVVHVSNEEEEAVNKLGGFSWGVVNSLGGQDFRADLGKSAAVQLVEDIIIDASGMVFVKSFGIPTAVFDLLVLGDNDVFLLLLADDLSGYHWGFFR